MPDVQRIVDEVRFRLQSADCELTDDLRQLSAEYAQLCHDVNLRLRRCGEFLKQGLRAEAMHLAEADPKILDLFAVIDFPERAEWDEILGIYNLPRPEPLLADVAEQLNEAYVVHAPHETLLDRHRLLAISRAPLAQRLAIMDKLADADVTSPFWDEDIRLFEKARALEIEMEGRSAADRGDSEALYSLACELSSREWRDNPPSSIVQRISHLALNATAEELMRMYSSASLERARLVLDRWNELSSRRNGTLPKGLAAQVAPAMKWLTAENAKAEQSRRFGDKLKALEELLSDPAALLDEIEQAREEVEKLGRDVPEPLAATLYARIVELKRGARTRGRKIIGVACVAFVVVAGISGLLIRTSLRTAAARQVSHAADQFIAQGNLRQARQLLNENEWMSARAEYLASHAKLVEAEKKEQTRIEQFRTASNRARSANSPEEADLALKDADRLAITLDERTLVDDLTSRWKFKAREIAENEQERFQKQLTASNDLLDRIDDLRANRSPDAAFFDALKTAEQKIAELKKLAVRVKPALALHADAAEARLARIHTEIANIQMRGALLDEMTRLSLVDVSQADPDAQVRLFAATLKKYSQAFPSDPKSRDFAAIAPEAELWRGVVAWQQLLGGWKKFCPADLAGIKARIGKCNSWLRTYPKTPLESTMREYTALLKRVVDREEDSSGDEKEGLRSKLVTLFSGPLIDDVQIVEFKDGRAYYVKNHFEGQKGDKLSFHYIVGFSGETKAKFLRLDELKIGRSREAPQTPFCKRMRAIVGRATLTGWNDELLKIAESLQGDEEMDPFLRYYLLLRTLEYAQEGDTLLEAELDPIVAAMRDRKIGLATRWMNPDDRDVSRIKGLVAEKLKSVGDLKPAWKRARKSAGQLEDRVLERVVPIGWLSAEQKERWQCRSNWAPHAEFGLWVAVPDGGGESARWLRIGNARAAGGLTLHKEASADLVEGRFVFARDAKVPDAGVAKN